MKWNSRIRCALVCLGFTALFSVFSFRLVYLQMIKHDEYAGLAAEKHVYKQAIYAERGSILDVNNEVLAHNTPVETVVADTTHLNNRAGLIPVLHDALKIPLDEPSEKLRDRRYIILEAGCRKRSAVALKEKLRAQNLHGIYFGDSTRIYPNGSMLCHVIGFTDFEHRGIQGGIFDGRISPRSGRLPLYRAQPRWSGNGAYRGQERTPRNELPGAPDRSISLQNIVENEIDAAMQEYTPQKATIILMRPQTGEILAMANRPHFDLNQRSETKPEEMKNRAIVDMMEPGSTFKIVSAAAALNEHKVRPDTTMFCENGLWNFGGRPLHDHKAYGELSVRDILVKSSNIGAAKLAISVGEEKFYEYIRRFGFGERTGMNCQRNRRLSVAASWSKFRLRVFRWAMKSVTIAMISAMATPWQQTRYPAHRKSITLKRAGRSTHFRR
jgi:cell division protein FtsI (penicillin-binding protein 3)/stage V sporulation protein D (sporulation-specific penicillin-binding protein)